MEFSPRQFQFVCSCGYTLKVHTDFGRPKDIIKCRVCGKEMKISIAESR